jgi:dihydrofolate reductase
MRKLMIQVQTSLDGFMADRDGGLGWTVGVWDEELNAYVGELTAGVDAILMGRKLAEGFIPYWKGVAADPSNPERGAGRSFDGMEKYVFSRSPRALPWERTRLVTEDLAPYVAGLKAESGGDLIAYGGVEFISSLVETGLVDEYNLFLNPTALGQGLRIFPSAKSLRLIKATQFACGVTALRLG